MVELTLTDEQFKLLQGGPAHAGDIVVRNPSGAVVGYLQVAGVKPFTAEEIAAAKRSASTPGPRYTTQEVLDYLHSLEKK